MVSIIWLTLYVLKCCEIKNKEKSYDESEYNSSMLNWHNYSKFTIEEYKNCLILGSLYHAW